MGTKWNAACIYEYYLCLRVVGLKRQKGGARKHGTGMAAAETSGSALRKELLPWHARILKESDALLGKEVPVSDSSLKERTEVALRYLYALILQDLRPPWTADKFPQALPGAATLSRYSRPCVLQ